MYGEEGSKLACSCGKNKQKVNYQVTFNRGTVHDGSSKTFDTLVAAQAAVRSNKGGMYKAVRAVP